jgi:ketosteroid isomerase-like protein
MRFHHDESLPHRWRFLDSAGFVGLALLLAAALPLAGCVRPGEEETPDLGDTFYSPEDEDPLSTLSRWRMTAVRGEEADAFLDDLAEDAVIMAPDEPTHQGRDDIRAWILRVADQYAVHGAYEESERVVSGDWAFVGHVGTTTLDPRDGGEPRDEITKGITVYQRQPDGGWKIVWIIWNRNQPPTAH